MEGGKRRREALRRDLRLRCSQLRVAKVGGVVRGDKVEEWTGIAW